MRVPQALTFPVEGKCTVMAAHFVDRRSLWTRSIIAWLVLRLLKCLTQCSYWPKVVAEREISLALGVVLGV